uniref:Transmembrane protein n=1 Tax=Moniliophthora roreri TaxID=221103 RepID=A0A0W0G5V6_MONRR
MSDLDSDAFVREINEAYFNACNFESLMRGIHIAVLISALSKIYTRRPQRSSHTMAFLIILLFVLSTIHCATFWAYVRRAFIARGQTAQSTADALNEYPVWFTGTTGVSDANAVLADCIIIWRTWVVWGQNWWIIVVPIISTMLMTAFSIIAIYQTVTSTSFGAVGVDYATALYSSTLATTIFCTCAIVYRIVTISKDSNNLRTYRGVMEVFVESSALYCVATMFALIAYVTSGPASEYASAFWTAVTGIAPTLLVARVASGEARPDDTWAPSASTRLGHLSFTGRSTTDGYELHTNDVPATSRAGGYSDYDETETSAVNNDSPKHVREDSV